MYETREEVEDVHFGNLDAAVDQLIFARSRPQDKMKRDPKSGSRLVISRFQYKHVIVFSAYDIQSDNKMST